MSATASSGNYGKIKQVNEYFCTILADQVMLPLLAEHGLV